QEAIDEALRFEGALARLRTERRVALLHYSPIRATCEGEPLEIFAFLGTSRLEEQLNGHPVDMASQGKPHLGDLEGAARKAIPVSKLGCPRFFRRFPEAHPFGS